MLLVLFITGISYYAYPKTVSLNFDDVDIRIFLKTMSEITGKSFVISDKVQGTISFVSARNVPTTKVYDIVLSILEARGFYAVPKDDNLVHIYPAPEALTMSGMIYYGTEPIEVKEETIVTQIIPLEYANAIDVLNTTRMLFGRDLLLSAYVKTNVILANGYASKINLLIEMVNLLDTEIPQTQSDIHIYRLENSNAESMAKTLSSLASSISPKGDSNVPRPPGMTEGLFSERFNIVANKETNSLIIVSAPQDYEKLENIIRELDVKREQVLVEALIVEVTLTDDQTLGFDWRVLIDTEYDTDVVASSNTGLMSESIATGGLFGLTVGLLNGTIPTVYAILNANKENTNFKILSTPEIVTIDNNEATISIGEQIPFLTSSRVDESGNVIRTYDYKDIGIILKLTPHINKSGYITMNINQQVKKIVEGTSTLENPSVFNREINSTVTVQNERTIVIGGLIRDDATTVERKVPILGDIPLLGLLFKRKTKQRVRTNLLIFITPHIVTDDAVMSTITEEKKKEQEDFEKK